MLPSCLYLKSFVQCGAVTGAAARPFDHQLAAGLWVHCSHHVGCVTRVQQSHNCTLRSSMVDCRSPLATAGSSPSRRLSGRPPPSRATRLSPLSRDACTRWSGQRSSERAGCGSRGCWRGRLCSIAAVSQQGPKWTAEQVHHHMSQRCQQQHAWGGRKRESCPCIPQSRCSPLLAAVARAVLATAEAHVRLVTVGALQLAAHAARAPTGRLAGRAGRCHLASTCAWPGRRDARQVESAAWHAEAARARDDAGLLLNAGLLLTLPPVPLFYTIAAHNVLLSGVGAGQGCVKLVNRLKRWTGVAGMQPKGRGCLERGTALLQPLAGGFQQGFQAARRRVDALGCHTRACGVMAATKADSGG